MKFFERIFPGFLKSNTIVFNISVLLATAGLFFLLLIIGALISILLTFLIDSFLKSRGYHLEMVTMALILILFTVAALADLIFCLVLLFTNLRM